MIAKSFLAAALFYLLAVPAALAEKTPFTFTYVGREDDPAYQEQRAYTGLKLRQQYPAFDAVKLSVRENKIRGRAINVKFDLEQLMLTNGQDAATAIVAAADAGQSVFVLDLPAEEMVAAAKAIKDRDIIAFNIRHPQNNLRTSTCSVNLFHTIPSQAMLMDSLAQLLRQKGWKKVLVLEGQLEADQVLAAAFQRAAKKFALKIVDVRPFELSNDPRARDRNNIALMTTAGDYDVIFLADTMGEFGRYVPYQTHLARPIIGTEGLIPTAWHWTMERYGAPQLNQRFDKRAKRSMTSSDWAAWAAVKAVVEAIVRTGKTDIASLRPYLTSDAFTLDLYKGAPGSFRDWNNQLRQPILLRTHNAVITVAPLEEFLHKTNVLDTIGYDRSESECRLDVN